MEKGLFIHVVDQTYNVYRYKYYILFEINVHVSK